MAEDKDEGISKIAWFSPGRCVAVDLKKMTPHEAALEKVAIFDND